MSLSVALRTALPGLAVACALAALAGPATAAASGPPPEPAPARAARPAEPARAGQIIVRFRPGAGRAARAAATAAAGATAARRLRLPRARLLRVPPHGAGRALAALRADPAVAWAAPNRTLRLHAVPDDPRFAEQWALGGSGRRGAGPAAGGIQAVAAWDRTTGSRDVRVAMLDSGIAYDHPDLAPNVFANPGEAPGDGVDDDGNGYVDDVRGWDFFDQDADPMDPSEHAGGLSHGSHTAGIVGAEANNGLGIAGVIWDVSLIPLRICGPDGTCPEDAVMDAMVYAGAIGADVANVSFGAGGLSPGVRDAMRASPDVLFVAAAGNDSAARRRADNDAVGHSPCNEPVENVVCVAATNRAGALAPFSNFGRRSVDIGAPGVDVLGPRASLLTNPPVLSEGFEEPLEGRWLAGGTPNGWTRTAADATLGSFSVTDSPAGTYGPRTDADLRTVRPLDLRGQDGCVISFWARYDTEPLFDFLVVQTSPDGAHWGPVSEAFAVTGKGSQRLVFPPRRFSQRPEGYVRLRLVSDENDSEEGGHDGAYVDDLSVTCARFGAYRGNEFRFLDGTSFAAPHVTGVAALIESAHPELGPAQVRRAIVEGAVPEPSLARATVAGGRLSAVGALEAADRLAGVPPPPRGRVAGAAPPAAAGDPLCAPVPLRRRDPASGAVRLSARQLLINQRIAQAAVRRANAARRWLDAGVEARDLCGGAIGAADLGPGIIAAGTDAESAPVPAHPRPVIPERARRHPAGRVTLSARQLLVDQRIAQAAVRRIDALDARLAAGLTDADLREGAITPGKLAPGLAIAGAAPAGGAPASPSPPPGRVPAADGAHDRVTLSARQLRINQRIAQAAVRRANAFGDRLERGLTGAEIRDGSITAANLAPALRTPQP